MTVGTKDGGGVAKKDKWGKCPGHRRSISLSFSPSRDPRGVGQGKDADHSCPLRIFLTSIPGSCSLLLPPPALLPCNTLPHQAEHRGRHLLGA